jgi:hypothetical protein
MLATYIQKILDNKIRGSRQEKEVTSASETAPATSPSKIEFEEYIVQRDEKGIWRKCPYCGAKVWDGPHSVTASGFDFHLNTKILAHNEKPEWKLKYGKNSWHLGTQKTNDDD